MAEKTPELLAVQVGWECGWREGEGVISGVHR